eukprot:CAMPEP_0114398952 /NCGR_PEP_ID=MMETSP0102-20121206/15255_1 /TAXON_ID=38822 ORGANISM="Pteridomonas danica, Strain PT" /NCGR_SAMPLE_ID=MMETSP0102 /ASSEMBLY_ACC=CAM_ASM_000212 /LENGTH=477 /DNA_ID=CAMNT_0001560531 /DNA_START=460 /DNA_END=1893 /DNA_ORIENTATION=+
MVFYYCSSNTANRARRSGLPAQSKYNGIPFTLREPHATTQPDFDVFNPTEEYAEQVFPDEEVLVLSIPRRFLDPLPGYEDDDGLCMVSCDVLRAMRPSSFVGIVDSRPWISLLLLLPPQCILRSFLILQENPEKKAETSQKEELFGLLLQQDDPMTPISQSERLSEIYHIDSIKSYIKEMNAVRSYAKEFNLMPLYHYTTLPAALLIMKNGLRMSSGELSSTSSLNHHINNGEGGVFLTTQSPASYGLGTKNYEVNLIKDFLGIDKIKEFEHQANFDAFIVYGCSPNTLEQNPKAKGKKHSKMFSRKSFVRFSLPDANGNYFLRTDRILGCFLVKKKKFRSQMNPEVAFQFKNEIHHDRTILRDANLIDDQMNSNITRIDQFLQLKRSVSVPRSNLDFSNPRSSSRSDSDRSLSSGRSSHAPSFPSFGLSHKSGDGGGLHLPVSFFGLKRNKVGVLPPLDRAPIPNLDEPDTSERSK